MATAWRTIGEVVALVTACTAGGWTGCGVMDDPPSDSDVVELDTGFRRHHRQPVPDHGSGGATGAGATATDGSTATGGAGSTATGGAGSTATGD